VLYAGPSRVAFVPHAVNLPHHRGTVEIPGKSLQVEVRSVPPGVMQRFLAPGRSFERLVLSSAGQSWELGVPRASVVAPLLERVVAESA